jgi:hypothetical protein
MSDIENKSKQPTITINGHTILENLPKSRVKYQCGTCSAIHETRITNLKRSTGVCLSCANNKIKEEKTESAKLILDKHGFDIVKYSDNKNVSAICRKNNHNVTIKINDLNRGRGCPGCAEEKRKETIKAVYKVDNISKSEHAKKKTIETNLERYGGHPLTNKSIMEKLMNTCMDKWGVKFAFCQEFVYKKIQETHLKNFGCKYPLQSSKIQAKISETFLKNYGARRPFLSETFMENLKNEMMRKHGVEYYIQSEECKAKMVEKYGVEYYIQSEDFKNTMIKKYGCVYALQNPDLYHKCIKSLFSNKQYIFPNTKREITVMGYEHKTINTIIADVHPFLNRTVEEDEVLVGSNVPSFTYIDDDRKDRRYYPDIFIKDTKFIYEVKSLYTFNLQPRLNFLKFKKVASEGYILLVYIYSSKELFDIWIFDNDTIVSKLGKTTTFDSIIINNVNKETENITANTNLLGYDSEDFSMELFINEIVETNIEMESNKTYKEIESDKYKTIEEINE